jgi:hypothetical protein
MDVDVEVGVPDQPAGGGVDGDTDDEGQAAGVELPELPGVLTGTQQVGECATIESSAPGSKRSTPSVRLGLTATAATARIRSGSAAT